LPSPDDELLRSAFDSLRRADRERVPSFRSVLQRPRQRSRPFGLALAACALLLVIAASIVLLRRPQTTAVANIDLTWRGPTDFLLDTPGRELGRDLPRIAAPVPNYPMKGNNR
jgi:hypothetical protein